MEKYICYCFEFTEQDIIDDLRASNGTSSIIAKISEAKKKGNCNCDIVNPKKT